MNARQRKFVQHYLLTGNATQAAISAGYSEATAKQQGSRLLTNVDIAAAVEEAQDRVEAKIEEEFERDQLSVLRNIDSIGKEARADKNYPAALKAEHLIGTHLGLWPNRIEHTGKGGGPIKTENTTTLDASQLDPQDRQALRAVLRAARGGDE